MTPYWLSEKAPPLPLVRVDEPDVVIIGGGVTGCTAALRLAQAGRRVRLYDAREIAGGASGRNGGFALRGMPSRFDLTATWLGEERARELMAWTEAALDTIEGLAGDAFRRVGSLRIVVDGEEELAEVRAEYDALTAAGFEAEWVEASDLTPPGRFTGALRHLPDGVLQPARFVRRLAHLAATAGVDVREHTRVSSLGEFGGATVVVCTDGYPSGLLGPIEGLIIPTRGQVIATEPIPERLFEIPHYGRHEYDYWHQAEDGRIVLGGFRDVSLETEFTAEEALTDSVQQSLRRFADDLVGRKLRVDYAWAGIFGIVMDMLPVVGRAPGLENVWVAGGYSGHGNVLGFACGELVAQAVAGDGHVPFLDVFDPSRLLNSDT
ncbi:MAG: FAD-dependent oxidoreductase [Thermoleophilia bacterium]